MSELRDPPENDDFEWVNSWAGAATPATDKPKPEPTVKADNVSAVASQLSPTEVVASAPPRVVADVKSVEAPPAPRPEIEALKPVAPPLPTPGAASRTFGKRKPNAEQFVHPATRRFFAALRLPAGRSEAPAPTLTSAPAPGAQPTTPKTPTSSVAAPGHPPEPVSAKRETLPITTPVVAPTMNQPAKTGSVDASLVPDANQLERDIAEIESARDALLEPAPFTINDPRKPRSPLAVLRNAESVPILVGSVVGATLLLVFGAAASLISLR